MEPVEQELRAQDQDAIDREYARRIQRQPVFVDDGARGFLVLSRDEDGRPVWVRCLACEGADVHASAAEEHVEARCLARNAGAYRAERLIDP